MQEVLQEGRSRAPDGGNRAGNRHRIAQPQVKRSEERVGAEGDPVAEARQPVQQRQLPVRAVQADEEGKCLLLFCLKYVEKVVGICDLEVNKYN